jgi:hypothetical protein
MTVPSESPPVTQIVKVVGFKALPGAAVVVAAAVLVVVLATLVVVLAAAVVVATAVVVTGAVVAVSPQALNTTPNIKTASNSATRRDHHGVDLVNLNIFVPPHKN